MFPVAVSVDAQAGTRNRLTVALRPILAVPHAILVGPVYLSSRTASVGLLGAAAYVLAIISWFTILVTGEHYRTIRDFCLFYLRWRARALAYMALFVDPYPPFGDGPYPAGIDVTDPGPLRDRATIAVRLLLAVPHLVMLALLFVAWFFATMAAWVVILVTGSYPRSLLPFGLGVMRWALRVEAYLLLLVDAYPPFTLD